MNQLKKQLVQAILMLERVGIIDFNGHYSVRIPNSDHLLINSGKSVRSALTEKDIITIDLDGKLIDGEDSPPMEFHIHTEIYKKRKDIRSIVHSHPKWSTLFTIANKPLTPVINQAAVLGEWQLYPRSVSINTKELGQEVATALGEHRCSRMWNGEIKQKK